MDSKTYMVISPHTKQECLKNLDEISEKGPEALAKWQFGCNSGDHTGYELTHASNYQEASETVPEFIRKKAKVVEVMSMTEDQIASLHATA